MEQSLATEFAKMLKDVSPESKFPPPIVCPRKYVCIFFFVSLHSHAHTCAHTRTVLHTYVHAHTLTLTQHTYTHSTAGAVGIAHSSEAAPDRHALP